MARKNVVQPFFLHQPQGLLQRVEQVHRGREGRAVFGGILAIFTQIQVVLGQGCGFVSFPSLGTNGHKAQTGRNHVALLGTGSHHVQAPLIDRDAGCTQAGDRIHHHQRTVSLHMAVDRLQVVDHPRGGFAVGDNHRLDALVAVGTQAIGKGLGIQRFAPIRRQGFHR